MRIARYQVTLGVLACAASASMVSSALANTVDTLPQVFREKVVERVAAGPDAIRYLATRTRAVHGFSVIEAVDYAQRTCTAFAEARGQQPSEAAQVANSPCRGWVVTSFTVQPPGALQRLAAQAEATAKQ